MENVKVSWWGGREHFITVVLRSEESSETCRYLDEWRGTSIDAEAGDEGFDSEMIMDGGVDGDDGGESSRERLTMMKLWM